MRQLYQVNLAPPGPSSSKPSWWHDIISGGPLLTKVDESLIALGYSTLALVALVQLVRIQRRAPEFGWTTQKVFHLFNLLVCTFRALVFVFRPYVISLHELTAKAILYDLPGLLFVTTYTLLVLFWAEIYNQARGQPTRSLRPAFMAANAAVYAAQALIWLYLGLWRHPKATVALDLSGWFMAAVSVSAAVAFLIYGGRLFMLLQRFPVESRGRRKKLREVGTVTAICTGCFAARSLLLVLSVVDKNMALDNKRPGLDLLYYYLCEIAPMAAVLFILRKLPPRRSETQKYRPVRTRPFQSPPTRTSHASEGYSSLSETQGTLVGQRTAQQPASTAGDLRQPLLIPGGGKDEQEEEEEEGHGADSDAETEASESEGVGGTSAVPVAGVLDTPR